MVMAQYNHDLSVLEKELFKAVSQYQKALEEEKLKEVRNSLL